MIVLEGYFIFNLQGSIVVVVVVVAYVVVVSLVSTGLLSALLRIGSRLRTFKYSVITG